MLGVSPAQGVNPGLAGLLLLLSLLRGIILAAVTVAGSPSQWYCLLLKLASAHISLYASEHTVLLPGIASARKSELSSQHQLRVSWEYPAVQPSTRPSFKEEQR